MQFVRIHKCRRPVSAFSRRLSLRTRGTNSRKKNKAALKSSRLGKRKARGHPRTARAAAADPADPATAVPTAAPDRFSNSGRGRNSVPGRPGDTRSHSVRASRQPHGNSSGTGYGKAGGRGTARGGKIAPSVEAMAATAFPRPASGSLSGGSTGSGCASAPRSTWDIGASGTAAFLSCGWIPGRNTGQRAGTPPMTFTLTRMADTSFTTGGIPASDLRLPLCIIAGKRRSQSFVDARIEFPGSGLRATGGREPRQVRKEATVMVRLVCRGSPGAW